jgi:oligopeptide/dipeptide ABC transporter ATP-binding protein
MTIENILLEPFVIHNIGTPEERRARINELLKVVGLRPEILSRYPHEFSGGQRQRIGIARALTLNPSLIVADEPVSALDVSVQAQVLNLIRDLQIKFGISFLFIAHDLAVVQHISDDVGVMYLGSLVEKAESTDLYARPLHPYTQALLSAVPIPDPKIKRSRVLLTGEIPSPLNPPSGCRFHTRCPKAMPQCTTTEPNWTNQSLEPTKPHLVKCHLFSNNTGS